MEAADALTAWLDGFVVARPRPDMTPIGATTDAAVRIGEEEGASGGEGARPSSGHLHTGAAPKRAGESAPVEPAVVTAPCPGTNTHRGDRPLGAPLGLPNPDWLDHHLAISGPADEVARFRAAAAGPGVIPWHFDLDGAQEDLFHLLVAPPAPHPRVLSAVGARIVAAELRDAMQRQHAMALARVGRSRACPFDLHALLPVPDDVLALGADHADALAWLWAHWGTTRGLRRVEVIPAPRSQVRLPEDAASEPGQVAFHLGFWSADWTPWRALARLAELWPALRFRVRPLYDRESG